MNTSQWTAIKESVLEFDITFLYMLIWYSSKSFHDSLKYLPRTFTRDSHSNLSADFLFRSLKDEIIGEGLQARTLAIR